MIYVNKYLHITFIYIWQIMDNLLVNILIKLCVYLYLHMINIHNGFNI